jgi:GntR family transcriptional regulator/MocR family aminotransferase
VEEHVIYLGSFAKTLFPGLKIAYLVVPDGFSRSFIQAVRQTGQEPSLPLQAALCDFIEKGYFSRHIRRMRAVYAERRATLIDAIARYLGTTVTLLPSEGGLQLAILLANGLSDKQLSVTAARQGITAQPLSDYFINTPQPQGFVLGFAATPAELIDSALAKLAAIIRA